MSSSMMGTTLQTWSPFDTTNDFESYIGTWYHLTYTLIDFPSKEGKMDIPKFGWFWSDPRKLKWLLVDRELVGLHNKSSMFGMFLVHAWK